MRRALVALVVAVPLVWYAYARACSCASPSLQKSVGYAKVAFVGTVTKTTKTSNCNPKHPTWCTHSYSYEVAVEQVWKGSVAASVAVSVGTGAGDCSHGSLGNTKRWLFLAQEPTTGPYYIRLCSGTQPATPAVVAEMTKTYGAPKSP